MSGADPAVEDLVDMVDGDEEDLYDGEDVATDEDVKFDRIVGVLEGIVMDPAFRSQHEAFCKANCGVFENTDENKLIYTDLFKQYTDLTETHIETRLVEEIEDFSMEEFMAMLEARPDEISGDLFDLLLGFGDFDEFKSLMLSYKEQFGAGGGAAGQLVVPTLAPTVTHVDADISASFTGLSVSGQAAGSDSAQVSQSIGEAPGESRVAPKPSGTSGAPSSEGAP